MGGQQSSEGGVRYPDDGIYNDDLFTEDRMGAYVIRSARSAPPIGGFGVWDTKSMGEYGDVFANQSVQSKVWGANDYKTKKSKGKRKRSKSKSRSGSKSSLDGRALSPVPSTHWSKGPTMDQINDPFDDTTSFLTTNTEPVFPTQNPVVATRRQTQGAPEPPQNWRQTALGVAAQGIRPPLKSGREDLPPPPPPDEPPPTLQMIVAESFTARNAKELTVTAPEQLVVLRNDKNWWLVRNLSGDTGFVPNTHLKTLDNIPAMVAFPPATKVFNARSVSALH